MDAKSSVPAEGLFRNLGFLSNSTKNLENFKERMYLYSAFLNLLQPYAHVQGRTFSVTHTCIIARPSHDVFLRMPGRSLDSQGARIG